MNLSKQFTRREKVLLCIFAFLCLVALYLFAVHYPVTNALARAETDLADSELQLQVLQAQSQRMKDMAAELDALPNNAPQTPDYDNLQHLAVFLDSLVQGTEDYEVDFHPIITSAESPIVRRPLEMHFTCPDYAAARRIVEQLEDCPYRCLVESVIMESALDEKNALITQGAVECTISVTFFERTV